MAGIVDEAGRQVVVGIGCWSVVDAPAANTQAAAVKAAPGVGRSHYVTGVYGSFHGGAPAAGTLLELVDGATAVWKVAIASAGPFAFTFPAPVLVTSNAAATARLGASGAGVSGIACLVGYTKSAT